MKKTLPVLGLSFMVHLAVFAQVQHPPKCGMQQYHEAMIARNPLLAEKYRAQRASLQAAANYYLHYKATAGQERTSSAISAVPVVFHIIVDSAQFNNLGGTAGIIKRCDSQIAVLNADYNRQNADSALIPTNWKPLYGDAGIHFGLAHIDPGGNCSPGYEVKIISGSSLTDAGFSDIDFAFPEAKASGTGLPSWDYTKYYNVWCINFTGAAASLLGITIPLSDVAFGTPSGQVGVCILYNTLGSTGPTGSDPGTGNWPNPYNLGRTLTHETGHFFEIWHPWGDDGGQCPTWSSDSTVHVTGLSSAAGDNGITCTLGVGSDDGLSDTPPESDAVYGNPSYTITGGTTNDCCQFHDTTNTQPIGIACLSYMDYTDDDAMHMFTTMQAAAMASMVLVPPSSGTGATGTGTIGENYNLTQNPSLLVDCTHAGVAPSPTELRSSLSVYPNPTNGEVNISINSTAETLNEIVVINLLCQQIMTVKGQNKDYYSIDLSGMSKGIYFVKCNFASGSVTRKILLQ